MTVTIYNTTAHCFMQVQFTGSGITVRGLQAIGNIDFTATLDGITLLPPIQISVQPDGSPTRYNVSLLDLQTLTPTFHTLFIDSSAHFFFDDAYVNETNPSAPPPSSSTTTTSSSAVSSSSQASIPTSSSHSLSTPVRAIGGGVVGGVAVIAAVAAVLLYCRRRKTRTLESDMQPTVTMFNRYPYSAGHPPPPLPQHNTMANAPSASPLSATYQYPSDVSNFTLQQQSHTSPTSADSLIPLPSAETGHARTTSPSVGEDWHISGGPAPDVASSTSQQLTEEQATYLQTLYSLNAPAPAIAVVIERMLQEGGTPTGTPPRPANNLSFGSVVKRAPSTASHPPRYDG